MGKLGRIDAEGVRQILYRYKRVLKAQIALMESTDGRILDDESAESVLSLLVVARSEIEKIKQALSWLIGK